MNSHFRAWEATVPNLPGVPLRRRVAMVPQDIAHWTPVTLLQALLRVIPRAPAPAPAAIFVTPSRRD